MYYYATKTFDITRKKNMKQPEPHVISCDLITTDVVQLFIL